MKVYEFLNEVLNSDVPTTTDDDLRKSIIQTYGKNIISGHTSVWQSEIMKKNRRVCCENNGSLSADSISYYVR
jgi:hypothetical protein